MLCQIGDVETVSRQNVALPERLGLAPHRRIEPFVDVGVHLTFDVFQTTVAWPLAPDVDAPRDDQHSIGATQFESNARRLGEGHPFERLDRHLVVDEHDLPAAGEQSPDIEFYANEP